MAGTFKFTFGGNYDSSNSVDLYKSNTLLSSFVSADNYCYIGNSTSVTNGMVYSVDKSTTYLLFASQSLSLKDAGGLYLDFSDGNNSAEFHGNLYGDVLIGGSHDDLLYGGSGDDQLTGNDGNDTLQGDSGADTMVGGAGDDTYYVIEAGDVVTEAADGGNDTAIFLSGSQTQLADNVENLKLVGWNSFVKGNSLDNVITGSDTVNNIYGEEGNDTIDGGGSYDSMYGGTGDDTYIVDNQYDFVEEDEGEGDDTVKSSVDYTLTANVERLQLTGSALAGTGNDEANTITGNELGNALDGGAGNDTMVGGAGDDTYLVDSSSDVVTEMRSEGSDTVDASVTYALGVFVEKLVLTGSAVSGTGNDLRNTITGNELANKLDGGGGADTLVGGAGDDTYLIDNPRDVVTENDGEGTDSVRASVNFRLGAFVENLKLSGTAITGTGNDMDNTITGDGQDNILRGGAGADDIDGGADDDTLYGGAGKDTLAGGKGADIFVFAMGDTSANKAGADLIEGFSSSQGDRIDLSKLDANEDRKGAQHFTSISIDAFGGHAGQLRYVEGSNDTFIYGDTDGDKVADFVIHLDKAIALKDSLFLF